MVETMSKTRTARAEALEEWAEQVEPADLKIADTDALRAIAELAQRRSEIDDELTAAIREARNANRSWSEIGAMLGVSKQAAQRKYAATAS
jgi:predicted ATP-dependent protease